MVNPDTVAAAQGAIARLRAEFDAALLAWQDALQNPSVPMKQIVAVGHEQTVTQELWRALLYMNVVFGSA